MNVMLRSTGIVLGLLALVQCRVHAQEPARISRPACRQSTLPSAATLNLSDAFTVKGAGSRQVGDRTQRAWTGEHCAAWIRTTPTVDTDAAGRVLVVPKGEAFEAFQQDAQGTQEIVVTDLARHFRVDGREVLPTAADEKWLGDMTLEYARRAGLHASERAETILRTGGLKALFAEAEEISGARVRARFLSVAAPTVPVDGRAAFLMDAGRLLDRGVAWFSFVDTVPAPWRSDEAALRAIYTASAAVEPDELVERILQRFPPPHPASAQIRQVVEILINTLQTPERRTELRVLLLGASSAIR